MRGLSAFVVVACSASALASCTVLHSTTDPSYVGISYYLPRSLLIVKVDLYKSPPPGTKSGDNSGEKTAGKAGEKSGAKANDKYFATIDMVTPAGQSEKPPTRHMIVPDLKERYTLAYSSNPFFYDRYCVVTDSNSLLKSVEYAAQDQTPQIVLALTELGRRIGAFAGDRPADENTELVSSATVTFDPFDPDDVIAAERAINRTFSHRVDVRLVFPELGSFRRNEAEAKCRGGGGVCFRALSKTTLRLWDAKSNKLTSSVLVDVVNPYYTGHLDLDRAFMVEKVQRLGFESGALAQVIMRKPSEVLQTVKLPLAVVEAILAVPSNFVAKAAGNSANVQSELSSQETALTAINSSLAMGVAASSATYQPSCSGAPLN